MEIVINGINVKVTPELRAHVEKRYRLVDRQVSHLAVLTVNLREDNNPAITDAHHAEASLALKGVTLHASAAAPVLTQAINRSQAEIERQVKKRKEKQLKRREGRRRDAAPEPVAEPVPAEAAEAPAEEVEAVASAEGAEAAGEA